MSNTATRAIALTEAVKLSIDQGKTDATSVIALAIQLDSYIEPATDVKQPAAAAPAQASAKPATTAAKSTETKKVAPAAKVPTKEEVSVAIDTVLKAGRKPELMELLAKYEAKSASSVPESKRAEFIKKAAAISTPPQADEPDQAEEDLTA